MAATLQVDGHENPVSLADKTPRMGWEYSDPKDSPQAAYQVIVASSLEKLNQNVGDLWDSGVQAGDATQAAYAGTGLADETAYFWKVRVQNSKGVWSAEW